MAVILIVEDDFFISQNLECVLEDLGHIALPANGLAEALVHLMVEQPIDVLFTDIRLAGLAFGGYDVANQAVGLRPDLAVLYTSGSSLTEEMTGRFVPGGRFLPKPYSPAQVETFIREILH